jgi:hypothetical protein
MRDRYMASRGRQFFRRSEVGAWRDELTAKQVLRIEAEHVPMMRRLAGYRQAMRSVAARI